MSEGALYCSPSEVLGKAPGKCGFGAFRGLKPSNFDISQLVGRFQLLELCKRIHFTIVEDLRVLQHPLNDAFDFHIHNRQFGRFFFAVGDK